MRCKHIRHSCLIITQGLRRRVRLVGRFKWFFKTQFNVIALTIHDIGNFLGTNANILVITRPCRNETDRPILSCIRKFDIRISHDPNTVVFLIFKVLDILKHFSYRTVDHRTHRKR